jgi:hypothetical protein
MKKIQKFYNLKLKATCSINNLSNQFARTTLCVYVLSIILLNSLLCIIN